MHIPAFHILALACGLPASEMGLKLRGRFQGATLVSELRGRAFGGECVCKTVFAKLLDWGGLVNNRQSHSLA